MAEQNTAKVQGCVAVLEDDDALREDILVDGLCRAGFVAEGFACSAALYRALLERAFDVVVLDIGLPDEDGLSVARHLRQHLSIGIVVLTGHGDPRERVQGLTEAVDVWLPKPADVEVLAATVTSLLRRMGMAAAAGDNRRAAWRLADKGWRLLAPSGQGVDLAAAERSLLECLFATAGEPVARNCLIEALGADPATFDPHRLEMLVHRLRGKVAQGCGEALPLRSVRGVGYVLSAGD